MSHQIREAGLLICYLLVYRGAKTGRDGDITRKPVALQTVDLLRRAQGPGDA